MAGRASRLLQAWFYVSFFALPISGWVMWSTLPSDLTLSIAGVIPFPNLPFEQLSEGLQHRLMQWAAAAHFWMVWITALAIPGHTGAAVLHYVIKRDKRAAFDVRSQRAASCRAWWDLGQIKAQLPDLLGL